MLSLPVITHKPRSKGPGYVPTMVRDDLLGITRKVMSAPSLLGAANVLSREARKLPSGGKGTWRWYFRRLARCLRTRRAGFTIFQEGNSKLPFYSFSALPGVTCPGAGECLDYCYSFTAWRYPGAWSRQVQNTLFLRHNRATIARAFHALPQGVVVRLYVDGDFDSARTVRFWFDLLGRRPDVRAYGYSKSWELIWAYAQSSPVPANYLLNLSSGGREQGVSREQMRALPFVRGDFLSVGVDYRPQGHKGNIGFDRYLDPQYHRAVRLAAEEKGLGKTFSCPGKCGECCGGSHACGSERMQGVTIVIGIH
jgi:hypothetical protein